MGSESIAHLLLNSFTHITLNKLKYLPENQDHLFFLHVKTKLEAFLSVLEHSANYNKCGFIINVDLKICVTTIGNMLL